LYTSRKKKPFSCQRRTTTLIEVQGKIQSNEELLAKYGRSDAAAFKEFYGRNSKLIYNYILSKTKNKSDADDAIQETFFRIHKYVHKFDPSQNALGWTFQIARNVMIDLFHKKTKSSTEEEQDGVSTDNPQVAVAAKIELERLLDKLAPEERKLLVSRFVDSDSFEIIAQQTGSNAANVRQKLSRLLKKLRTDV